MSPAVGILWGSPITKISHDRPEISFSVPNSQSAKPQTFRSLKFVTAAWLTNRKRTDVNLKSIQPAAGKTNVPSLIKTTEACRQSLSLKKISFNETLCCRKNSVRIFPFVQGCCQRPSRGAGGAAEATPERAVSDIKRAKIGVCFKKRRCVFIPHPLAAL